MSEKKDVLSYPVRAWNVGRAFALSEDIVVQMSLIEMFRNLFPIPISPKNAIPSTMMSMSFAITSMRCMQHHSRIELRMVAWP